MKLRRKKVASVVKVNSAYTDRTYLYFIAIQILFAICFFQMFTTVTVFFKIELHLSESLIGLIMAFNGILIALFEMIIVFKLEGRRPPVHYMTAGVFLVGLAYLALNLPIANALILALCSVFFMTIGEITSMPFMNAYWISRTNPENRGQYAALYTVAWSSAQAVGPFCGAQLAEHFGYHVLWWVVGTICILLMGAYWVLQKQTSK